jgi:hypothetical protein
MGRVSPGDLDIFRLVGERHAMVRRLEAVGTVESLVSSAVLSNGSPQSPRSSSFSGVIFTTDSQIYSGDPGTELLFAAVGGANTYWRLSPSSTPGLVLKSIFVEGSGGSVEVPAPYTFGHALPEPTSAGLTLAALCLAAFCWAPRSCC